MLRRYNLDGIDDKDEAIDRETDKKIELSDVRF